MPLILKLKGGLGNQLFQYAFGRLMASRRNEVLKLDLESLGSRGDTYRSYGLDNFKIRAEIARGEEVKRARYPHGIISKFWRLFSLKVLRRFHIGYEKRLLGTKSRYIEGFFQSHKYLDPIREELLAEISLKETPSAKFQDLVRMVAEGESVSVHIRRGDYVSDQSTRSIHFICDLPYYQQALALLREKVSNPNFFVFSDDIAWARENLKLDRAVFVSDPKEIGDCEELILMSKCRHNIIANSSFSFWGAWLNENPGKIVIAPRLWNRRYGRHYKDLLPEEWLRV